MESARSLIKGIMKKYNIPDWVEPYALKYARHNPLKTVKFALSFIETRRKKGAVANGYVLLPNGTRMKLDTLIRLLNIIFYEQDLMAKVAKRWANTPVGYDSKYSKYANEFSEAEAKHAIAIKNLIEGLGYKVGEPDKGIEELFDYIGSLDTWYKRLIAVNIVLRNAYAKAFGEILYKIFYSVSPEYMRAFRKVFSENEYHAAWGAEETRRIIREHLLSDSEVIGIAEEIVKRVLATIDFNMYIAKSAGVEYEVKFLRDISILYPFETLKEMGVKVDPDEELKRVKDSADRYK